MFNLEQSISTWRTQMLAAGIKSPVPLEELESHLRDEIQHHLESGLDAQTAFDTATQKIGEALMLKNEFQKNQPSFAQKIERYLPLIFATLIPAMIICFDLLKVGNFAELNSSQRLSGLTAAALIPFLTWAGWFAYRYFPVVPAKRKRNTILYYCVALLTLWWTAFFFIILPRYDFTIAQLCVTILWGFAAPTGILTGLITGFEKSATYNFSTDDGRRHSVFLERGQG